MDDLNNNFGKSLRLLRKRMGITQEQLASGLGVAKANISRYEKGTQKPEFRRLVGIAALLKVSPSELLGDQTAHFKCLTRRTPIMATRIPPIDYRPQVMACLRKRPMRTSELAGALGLEKIKVRQTGLLLQLQRSVRAEIMPGKGREGQGREYLFTLIQDDLFWQSMASKMTFWQRLKYLFGFSPT